ncbi:MULTISPECIES: acetyl-CoA carboxylase carboxyltransferase subunit alpha [unclassified Aureispira]|uniref:acetyl-CoA carboxylase carboxyltransferase subunit alpha n=1 Tax=unclassified Aureispira TaxID=2649989 RepID=UPI0006964BCA|nr:MULTISPECIES: acetyl-CoA carboxylase carboxyltransferase subunit alpha [unclassified Aureispira]WMX12862.1 acetyl-CoA carboxylase carboxyltransferase subunit alpha [Aureispira sp. CCB-E]
MLFLDFEKPIEELYEQLAELKKTADLNHDVDALNTAVAALEKKIVSTRKNIYNNLTGWQKVQLSRHPKRPYTLFYIEQMCSRFVEMHGDRCFKDDKAIVGGIGKIDKHSVMIIGQQKGEDIKMRQYRNFGMPNPEGYRKALRLMKTAERLDLPVICLIDTPGAFPGIEAEERGQAEAIARNLFEMAKLRVPIICVVIGEGASGGALGIGVGNRTFMMENTWYTVISPESCSTILWRNVEHKKEAAEALKLTGADALEFGIIDGIIKEPVGGAHLQPEEAAKILKRHLKKELTALSELTKDELVQSRIEKYSQMGRVTYKK